MWDIASTLRSRWIEVAWATFAAVNVVVILTLSDWETIPFHFVWVSLTLVYGFRVWRLRTTMILLLVVIAVTGAALAWTVTRGDEGPDELAEVPLMAAMFVAMVWHAHRRQAAIEKAKRLAESEHRLLEGQREFVRDASHELRTPITVARGHAELIRNSGAIMCMGVATANSVLVISFARERLEQVGDPVTAALEAGFVRFRPVLMTALAMIIGMAPMALGLGEGGEQNAPLGRAVVGGLVFATVATLMFVPVVFSMLHRREDRVPARAIGEPHVA